MSGFTFAHWLNSIGGTRNSKKRENRIRLEKPADIPRICQHVVDLEPRRWHCSTYSVLLAAHQRTSNARSRTELAAIGPGIVYVGSSLCAFAALMSGLFALAVYPLIGVLLTIGGMALLLYGAAGMCGAHRRKQ
jgi:hypothetical protein